MKARRSPLALRPGAGVVGNRVVDVAAVDRPRCSPPVDERRTALPAGGTTTGSRRRNDDRGPAGGTTTGVPQEERRPGSRRRNDDRGPAGGTSTGSRRRNDDRVPQGEPLAGRSAIVGADIGPEREQSRKPIPLRDRQRRGRLSSGHVDAVSDTLEAKGTQASLAHRSDRPDCNS